MNQIIYNDKAQTIQGFKIPDKKEYQNFKIVINSEHLEGFNPNKKEIEIIYNYVHQTQKQVFKEFSKDLERMD